jgi:hypothetical protein
MASGKVNQPDFLSVEVQRQCAVDHALGQSGVGPRPDRHHAIHPARLLHPPACVAVADNEPTTPQRVVPARMVKVGVDE